MCGDYFSKRQKCDILHLRGKYQVRITLNQVFSQFWSGSSRNAASFVTHSSASESPDACCSIPPTMQVCTHSYRRDIACVVEMSSVIGGWSFFTRRGSCGESKPNYGSVNLQCLSVYPISQLLTNLISFISIQLLDDVVIKRNS
jgi:hypothetical protein